MGEITGVLGLIIHDRDWRWWRWDSNKVVVRQPRRYWRVELEEGRRLTQQIIIILVAWAGTRGMLHLF